ncbi:MAG: NfeD family protein [Planctomycetales bacterium]|nr:NfeD family protein [Planctomycetales bacterium]
MSSMFWPSIVLLAAIALLVLELFVPSAGVIGVLSALGFGSAIIMAFMNGGLQMGTLFVAVTVVLVPIVLNFALKLWPKTYLGQKMLNQPSPAEQAVPAEHRQRQQWIGQVGIALTPLLPAGAIRIEDRTVDAISDGTPVDKGAIVEVVAVRGVHLIVRPRLEPLAEFDAPAPDRPLDQDVPDPFDDSLS